MSVFNQPAFDDHEQVAFCRDAQSGLSAIIAIHNTALGPALGGCRMLPYRTEDEALTDVLRLSKGMTYKSAVAGLSLGGGKSVIIGDPRQDKTPELMEAMGRFVEGLGGRYIVAEDSGTSVEDINTMARATRHVAGVQERVDGDGETSNGDPSPSTALGVFYGIRAAVQHKLRRNDLDGITVAIQGTGNVGKSLAVRLHEAGAKLLVSDIYAEQCEGLADALGATVVAPDEILGAEVDVLAPCALGAVLDDHTIARLRTPIVAGAANNQLAEERHGEMLRARGILYAPDYVINAGGVIDAAMQRSGSTADALHEKLLGIGHTLSHIFAEADATGLPTHIIANRIAEQRFKRLH